MQAISELLRLGEITYSAAVKRQLHTPFIADMIDEVTTERVVDMLAALPEQESNFYAEESNVVDWCGKSEQQLRELEEHYGFLGGSQAEWARYLRRADLPPRLWTYMRRPDIRAINGVSAVRKKDPTRLRKLIMAVPANYAWCDASARANHGFGGGGSMSLVRILEGSLDVSRCDQSNAFSSVLTPSWWWPWMATLGLPAAFLVTCGCPWEAPTRSTS